MSNLTKREQRRKERQRQQVRNILVIGGVALLAAAFFIWQAVRPVEITPITPKSLLSPVEGLSIGFPDAPVLVEAFEDFQCPSCLDFTVNIEPLLLQNFVEPGIARLVYRNYPFIGPESFNAANAALCANEQGRFWDYHDILFANQLGENRGAFGERRLIAMAESLGLEVVQFEACLDAETYDDLVQADFAEGRERTVVGTPSIFVNGQILPDYEYTTIAEAILTASGR
jgi:protein-disulfide isomerase